MNDNSRSGAKSNPGWFPKGHCGNPGGRPSTSRPSQGSAFDVLVEKTLTVTHHGATREITMEEALRQGTYRDAVAGTSFHGVTGTYQRSQHLAARRKLADAWSAFVASAL